MARQVDVREEEGRCWSEDCKKGGRQGVMCERTNNHYSYTHSIYLWYAWIEYQNTVYSIRTDWLSSTEYTLCTQLSLLPVFHLFLHMHVLLSFCLSPSYSPLLRHTIAPFIRQEGQQPLPFPSRALQWSTSYPSTWCVLTHCTLYACVFSNFSPPTLPVSAMTIWSSPLSQFSYSLDEVVSAFWDRWVCNVGMYAHYPSSDIPIHFRNTSCRKMFWKGDVREMWSSRRSWLWSKVRLKKDTTVHEICLQAVPFSNASPAGYRVWLIFALYLSWKRVRTIGRRRRWRHTHGMYHTMNCSRCMRRQSIGNHGWDKLMNNRGMCIQDKQQQTTLPSATDVLRSVFISINCGKMSGVYERLMLMGFKKSVSQQGQGDNWDIQIVNTMKGMNEKMEERYGWKQQGSDRRGTIRERILQSTKLVHNVKCDQIKAVD